MAKNNKPNTGKSNRPSGAKPQDFKDKEEMKSSFRNGKRHDYDHSSKRGGSHAGNSDCGHNDPDWYAVNPEILKGAASLSFFNPTGIVTPTSDYGFPDTAPRTTGFAVPGICRINYVPTFGISKDATSAVNLASRNTNSFVRKANSGTRPYDSPDLMITIMGVQQGYVYWAYMTRIYGLLNLYKTTNRYYPRAIIESMGLDFDDLLDNMPQFNYYINVYAHRLCQLAIPSDIKYMNRALWCVSHVWKDSDNEKAQLYYYHPIRFWQYDETSSTEGSFLKPIANTAATVAELKALGDQILAPLVTSDDVALICGDIRKAYGDSAVLVVKPIDMFFSIDTEYSAAVCHQIQNATAWADVNSISNIYQDPATNAILFDVELEQPVEGIDYYPTKLLLNSRSGAVTPEENMVGTRMMSMVEKTPAGVVEIATCGTEIVTSITYYSSNGTYWSSKSMLYTGNSDSDAMSIVRLMTTASQFDYHPMYYVTSDDGNSNSVFEGIFGDIDDYTWITLNDLKRMNECALLGLLTSKAAYT